jgi:hypothetical protein
LGAIAARAFIAEPAQVGPFVTVTKKGVVPDPATATTPASVKLTRRAASIGGKVKNSDQLPRGAAWRSYAPPRRVVCPMRLKSPLPKGGDATVTWRKLGLWAIRTNQFPAPYDSSCLSAPPFPGSSFWPGYWWRAMYMVCQASRPKPSRRSGVSNPARSKRIAFPAVPPSAGTR